MALLFNGDFNVGGIGKKSQYEGEWSPQGEAFPPTEPGTRITVVNATSIFPESGLPFCGKFEYRAGDAEVPANAGKRAELQRPNPYLTSGNDYWFDEWLRIDELGSAPYVLLRQLHEDEPPTGVAAGWYAESGLLKLKPGVGSSWYTRPITLGEAIHVKWHVRVSETSGIIEVWVNGTKQDLTNGKKIYENQNTQSPSNGGSPTGRVYDKIGINASRETTGNVVVYHGGARIYNSDPGETATVPALELWPDPDNQLLAVSTTGAEVSATTGLNVGENLENPYKEFRCGEERGSTGFGGTPLPNANPEVTNTKDTLWTPTPLTKNLKAGNWTVNWKVIATAGTGGKGRIRCRLWKSPDKTSAFTGLGEAQAMGEASLVIGEPKPTALTFALESVALNNEYLGIQIAWQVTAKATGATANVRLRKGAEVKITTPEEEAVAASAPVPLWIYSDIMRS